ncbi:MAG: hypothetical protein QM820_57960 [Minicystis sp.]
MSSPDDMSYARRAQLPGAAVDALRSPIVRDAANRHTPISPHLDVLAGVAAEQGIVALVDVDSPHAYEADLVRRAFAGFVGDPRDPSLFAVDEHTLPRGPEGPLPDRDPVATLDALAARFARANDEKPVWPCFLQATLVSVQPDAIHVRRTGWTRVYRVRGGRAEVVLWEDTLARRYERRVGAGRPAIAWLDPEDPGHRDRLAAIVGTHVGRALPARTVFSVEPIAHFEHRPDDRFVFVSGPLLAAVSEPEVHDAVARPWIAAIAAELKRAADRVPWERASWSLAVIGSPVPRPGKLMLCGHDLPIGSRAMMEHAVALRGTYQTPVARCRAERRRPRLLTAGMRTFSGGGALLHVSAFRSLGDPALAKGDAEHEIFSRFDVFAGADPERIFLCDLEVGARPDDGAAIQARVRATCRALFPYAPSDTPSLLTVDEGAPFDEDTVYGPELPSEPALALASLEARLAAACAIRTPHAVMAYAALVLVQEGALWCQRRGLHRVLRLRGDDLDVMVWEDSLARRFLEEQPDAAGQIDHATLRLVVCSDLTAASRRGHAAGDAFEPRPPARFDLRAGDRWIVLSGDTLRVVGDEEAPEIFTRAPAPSIAARIAALAEERSQFPGTVHARPAPWSVTVIDVA